MLYSLSSAQTGVIITLIKPLLNLLNLLKTKREAERNPKNKTSVIKML